MRYGDHALHGDKVLVREVRDIRGDYPLLDGLLEVFVAHKAAAREIEDPDSFFHQRELVLVEHALCLVVERDMQRDVIRFRKKVVQRKRAFNGMGKLPRRLNRNDGVIPRHFHAERDRVVRHLDANGAQADHAEPLSLDFRPLKIAFPFFDEFGHLVSLARQPLCPDDALHELARADKQARDNELLDAVGVCARRVHDHNALLGAFVYGNVVDAGPCACNGLDAPGQLHFVHVRAADKHGVRINYLGSYFVDIPRKKLKAFRGNFV